MCVKSVPLVSLLTERRMASSRFLSYSWAKIPILNEDQGIRG